MKKVLVILNALLIASTSILSAQSDSVKKAEAQVRYMEVNDYVMENEACLTCHGESKYILKDETSDREINQSMCQDKIIDRDDYYSMVHKSFACLDCHSYDYEVFPHALELRLEPTFTCLDCHGYDDDYAQYHFEDIDIEFQESAHMTANPDNFTCWKCHDPHSYKSFVRDDEKSMKEAIAYNNDICLNCHSDFSRYELLTDKDEIDLLDTHSWLPNQAAHFRNVRCIECHTSISDSVLVAHHVQTKDLAVRKCSECHSSNSILMGSLYKHMAIESRGKLGFVNAVILNEAYVIGANRNKVLSFAGVLIFLLALGGISAHIVARIIFKK